MSGARDRGSEATGADAVAAALKAAGVARVFALCGDHVNTLFHAVHHAGIEIVGTRHESAAVQMADGSARATGEPGVAIVTGGPGHTNAITGAAVAQGAQSPVVVLSGQAAKARRERGGNQSLHQAELMRPVTKWAIEAESAAGLAELTLRALRVAAAGTPGAVSLSIPVDVAEARAELPRLPHLPSPDGPAGAPDPDALASAAALIRGARKPVIILGGSTRQHAPYATLARAATALGIPVFTNGQARGVIPDDGELCFGHASPLFNALFRRAADADLWIVAGTTVDYNIASIVAAGARVVQVHRDARQLGVGRAPDLALEAGTAATLEALSQACRPTEAWTAWRDELGRAHAAQREYWTGVPKSGRGDAAGVHPAALCHALRPHHTAETTLVVDVGDFVNWPKAFFPALAPHRYMDGGALGNLGGAVPLAIGAAVARPEHPVWAFSGDGGFGFHAWELALAAERRLPLTVFVGNDGAWGTEKRLQREHCGADIACGLPNVRYGEFARLLGVPSFRVERADALEATLAEVHATPGPRLVEIALADQAGRPYAAAKSESAGRP